MVAAMSSAGTTGASTTPSPLATNRLTAAQPHHSIGRRIDLELLRVRLEERVR